MMRFSLLLCSALMLALMPSVLPAQTAAAKKTAAPAAALSNFKESGSPGAPLTIELYTDYECPACRELYLNVLPSVITDFVQTGKARLIHRDFPLPQHQYSRVAVRYANAAGQIGKYDLVAHQLFQTQQEWSQSGNVDGTVAKVLTPAEMAKVRDAVKNDSKLDESVAKDTAQGGLDRLTQTPTMVIVSGGKRETLAGSLPYPILKTYLEKKLGK